VVTQVALAVVLLVGAGLLIRSFAELTRVRLGFDPGHVLTAQARVSGERYDSTGLVNQFYDQVLQDIRRSPGVVAVGATMKLPTTGRVYSGITVVGAANDPTQTRDIGYTLVRGDYFQALGIPLRAGRLFDDRDAPTAPGTVIVNEAAVRTFFSGTDPIGRRVHLGPDPTAAPVTVIGVVGDTREHGLDIPPSPTVYASHVQNTWSRAMSITIRTRGDPHAAESVLRGAVRRADPSLALRDVRTLEAVLGSSLAARKFALGLVACFAAVALMLAAVGIYGVLAFSVSSRTREFGVRLALGATNQGVLVMVLRQGVGWSAAGLAIGVAGAFAGGRLLTGMLYGVSPADSMTFALVALGLMVVVVAACLIPATRAMRVDPITTMRAE
jgi:predicted permease